MKQKNRKLNHLQRGIIQILEFRKFQITKTINFPDHVFQKNSPKNHKNFELNLGQF